MNYEIMWKKLKKDLVADSGNLSMEAGSVKYCKRILLSMSRLESEEDEKDSKAGTQTYTIHQDITGRVDIKAPDIGKLARKSFEQITGYKIIENLEELENEIQKRKGKTPFFDFGAAMEYLVVDEKVNIPRHIYHEATLRGIRIARFGVDIMFPGGTPFVAK